MTTKFLITALSLPLLLTQCGPKDNAAYDSFLAKANETMDSVYSHYGTDSTFLLRENYPHDKGYEATYLASQERPNEYSYLWPYSGTLSAMAAIYEATGDPAVLSEIESRVIPGLGNYYDEARTPAAYSSYINNAPQSDRFYDDNIWLGIDFTDLFLASSDASYLDKAKTIWAFIESGTDDALGGGIYWCEQKKHSKNTCSNAPGAVFALKLFKATSDSRYLEKGKELYGWTKENLQDTTDFLYFDNINLKGEVNKTKFAYNSGQMLQAASLLYKITGEDSYLTDAKNIAKSAFNYFLSGGEASDSLGVFPRFRNGDIWFDAVMVRGFIELYTIDRNNEYMDAICRNLQYAWNNMREAETGLFNRDWACDRTDKRKWLLTQAAFAEMFARAASYHQHQ